MKNLEKKISNTYYTSNIGSVGHYLADISKYKILSDNETKNLIKKSKNGDENATEQLVKSNQRFVFSLAKRFCNGSNILLSDLINEANIGLINSIKFFDIKKDNKFLTYSVYWMQRQIFFYLTFVEPMVKMSNKAKTTKVSDINNKFMMQNGRNATSEEILNELRTKYGINISNESDLYQFSTTSIDNPSITENYDDFSSFLSTNQNYECGDISVVSQNNYDKDIENSYSKALISNSIGALTSKERKVIELLYGIDSYREYQVQEVAEKLGMTNEGIRLINKRALEKLKEEITINGHSI